MSVYIHTSMYNVKDIMANKQFMMTLDENLVEKAQQVAAKRSLVGGITYSYQDILREQINLQNIEKINRFYQLNSEKGLGVLIYGGIEQGEIKDLQLLLLDDGSYSAKARVYYENSRPLNDTPFAFFLQLDKNALRNADKKAMYFTHSLAISDLLYESRVNDSFISTKTFEETELNSEKIRLTEMSNPIKAHGKIGFYYDLVVHFTQKMRCAI